MSTKRKAPVKLATPVARQSAKISNKATIDESRTAVSGGDPVADGPEMIEISSDADSDEDLSDAEEEEEEEKQTNGLAKSTSRLLPPSKPDDEAEGDSDAEETAPSFGELLRTENETIDVPALLDSAAANNTTVATRSKHVLNKSHDSLTTVLTQALRTDDVDLLESCLHTTNLNTIRNTIESLDSNLALSLLTQLAARLHRRPGRANQLMSWVQWTMTAHGHSLLSKPKALQSLAQLKKVLNDRSRGLNSLLILKGRLDLLESQMDLRKRMARQAGRGLHEDNSEEDEDVIYVEGETGSTNGLSRRNDDSDDDVPTANGGFIGDSEDEEDVSEAEDDSEAAEESVDEDEVVHEDVDESMGEDDESDVDAAPPTKVQKTGGFAKRR